jgi:hypothetical protein
MIFMQRTAWSLVLIFRSLCAFAEPVYIEQGARSGAGYTFSDGDHCFVVTAEHVSPAQDVITVVDSWRARAQAEVVARGSLIRGQTDVSQPSTESPSIEALRYDVLVALMPLSSGVACKTQWDTGAAADIRLRDPAELDKPVLSERVTQDAMMRQQQARVAVTGRMSLQLKTDDNFLPGDSGSFLFYRGEGEAKHLAGMIVAVQGAQLSALPQSWLNSIIGPIVSKPTRAPASMAPPSENVNLPLADYAFASTTGVQTCATLCQNDGRCRAYSYVLPGVQGATGMCWLKYQVPTAARDRCCISGVKQYESPDQEAAAARIATEPQLLQGIWRDVGYSVNFAEIHQRGSDFEFHRKGQFPDTGERFEVRGIGRLDRRAVSIAYDASFSSSAASKGTCSGSVLEDQQAQMILSIRCTDSRLGVFQTSSVKTNR